MEVMFPRCAGLDVHKKLIVTCVRLVDSGRIVRKKERFGATTAELMRLADWLTQHQVTHAAIAYASHCTSVGRCETFSSSARLFDNLTPLAFSGGWGPGSSYRYSCLSLHR